jgi:hypothetical protein
MAEININGVIKAFLLGIKKYVYAKSYIYIKQNFVYIHKSKTHY